MYKHIRISLTLLLTLLLLACLLPAAYAEGEYDPLAELQDALTNPANYGNEYVINDPVEITGDLTIPENFALFVKSSVTIGENATLTNSGRKIKITDNGELIVNGTLNNNTKVEITDNGLLTFGKNGQYIPNRGRIWVYDLDNPDRHVGGLNLNDFFRVITYGDSDCVQFGDASTLDPGAVNNMSSNGRNKSIEIYAKDDPPLVVVDTLTVHENTALTFHNATLNVPSNATLTVNGSLTVDGLKVDGSAVVSGSGYIDVYGQSTINGSMSFTNENFVVRQDRPSVFYNGQPTIAQGAAFSVAAPSAVVFMYSANDYTGLVTAAENAAAVSIENVDTGISISNIPNFEIAEGDSVTISNNTVLNIERSVKLTNNGTINLNDGHIMIFGCLQNNGTVNLRPTEDLQFGWMLANSDGKYEGTGAINIYDSAEVVPTDEYIVGMNLAAFAQTDINGGVRLSFDTSGLFNGLKIACIENSNNYNLDDVGDFVIEESITIPANMSVSARRDRVIVPEGVTLTVKGELLTRGLRIEAGGKVIADGAHMDIPERINIEGTGNFELKNHAMIDTGIGSWNNMDKSKTTIESGSRFCPHFETQDEDEVLDAIDTIINDGLNEDPTCEAIVEIRFPFTVDRVTEVPAHTRLRTYEGAYIPEDKTFTVSAHSIFAIFNEDLVIDGSLVNNGTVNLNGPFAFLGDNGIYTQGEGGEVRRNGKPFTIGTRAQLLTEVEAAVADPDTDYYDLSNFGDFELTNGLTVDHDFRLEAYGTNIIIPSGKTLTIKSGKRFELHNLIVNEGASVEIEDGGYLNTYDSFALDGTLMAGNNVRMHIPADTDRSNITHGSNCDFNVHFNPETEAQLLEMLENAETLNAPFYSDIRPEFAWTVTGQVTFNRVHLSVNYKQGDLVIANSGVLTVNSGIYMDGAALIVESGGKLINNDRQIELDENNGSAGRFMGHLYVNEGGIYEGTGRIIVKNVDTDSADSYITGLNLARFNKYYDDGWEGTVYVDTGAILDGLRQAIAHGDDQYYLNDFGSITLNDDETLLIPEGMRVDAWGTTLVVPESSTLNVIGEYSGTGLDLYGQLRMGKASLDWDRPSSNVFIRDNMTIGANASIAVGIQANLNLPAYAMTDEVINNKITRVGSDNWISLNWNAFNADTLSAAISRVPTLPEGFNGHAEIRFPWIVNGSVVIPGGLDLFVDGAYDNGSITVPVGATLTSNDFINLNCAELNVAGTFVNNNRVEINYDEGDRYSGYGKITFAQGGTYSGGGDIRVRNGFNNITDVISGLDLYDFESFADGDYTNYHSNSAAFYAFKEACESGNPTDYYSLRDLGNFTILQNVTIPQNMFVDASGTSISVPAGCSLVIEGSIGVDRDITLSNSDSAHGALTVGENGALLGPAKIYVNNKANNPSQYITGIDDLTEGTTLDDNNAVFYSAGGFFDAVNDICNHNAPVDTDRVDLRDLGNFRILRDLTIPSDITVVAPNAAIVVPKNVNLRVEGAIDMTDRIDVNGRLDTFGVDGRVGRIQVNTFNANGFVSFNGETHINTLNIGQDNWIHLVEFAYGQGTNSEFVNINYANDNCGIKLFHHVNNMTELSDALSRASENTAPHQEDHIRLFTMGETWTLSDDLTVPVNANLHAHEPVVVPAGKTLTINGHFVSEDNQTITVNGTVIINPDDGHLIMGNNAFLTVMSGGSIVNNNRLNLQHHDNPEAAMTVQTGGSYSGSGEIIVQEYWESSDAYLSGLNLGSFSKTQQEGAVKYVYTGATIQMHLPTGLTTIESEAFAGGTFTSIYIPATVTSIANDAFDGMTGLTIYGERPNGQSTVAEEYANSHNIPFVLVG